jgi:hypothetical protein
MKLFLIERFNLLKLLSFKQQGGLLEMMHISNIRTKLSPTPDDEVKYDMKEEKGQTTWSLEKDKGEEIELSDREKEVIKGVIKSLPPEIEVSQAETTLYLKFIDINELES